MSILTVFVGLDYHQKSVQVCVLDTEGNILINRSVDNDLLSIYEVVRKAVRVVLIEVAQRLINFNAHWGQFAQRLLDKGKPRNVVVAAVANRWLRKLYHQMQPEQLALAT